MANDTFELYSLTSKLTLDTAQFDRAYGQSQSKIKTLAGDVNRLEAAAKSGTTGVKTFGGAISSLVPSLSTLAGPAGLVGVLVGGVTLLTGALSAAAVGVWDLTQRFSDIGSELQDMSDQVNFSTDTLGTFAGVGKSVGVELQDLSMGLVTFQKNLARGNEVFQILGVTSRDNEEALRQTAKALSNIQDKTIQSALAAEVFGRGGKSMLAILKATGGDIDAAKEKLRKWNVLLSTDAVEIADEFGDKLAELGLRAQGIGNTFAQETAPAFTAGFIAIEAALDSNTVQWKWWGEQIAKVILSAETLLGGLAVAIKNIDLKSPFAPLQSLLDFYGGANKTADIVVAEYLKRTQPNMDPGAFQLPGSLRAGSGISLEKDKKEKRVKEDPIVRLTERYKDQLSNLTATTEEERAQEELLGKEYEKSSRLQKELVLVLARTIDAKKKKIELEHKEEQQQKQASAAFDAFVDRQAEAVRQIRYGNKTAMDEFNDFYATFKKLGGAMDSVDEQWFRFNALLIQSARNAERLKDALRDISETTPPIAPNGIPTREDGNVLTPEDLRKMGEPPPEDPMAKWRRMADRLASDITYTIDRAIQRGFENGIGAGVKEFALGLLEIARSEALAALERAIAKALGGGGGQGESGGGGGGIWNTILNFSMRAVGALFGGGGGGGAFAGAGAGGSFAKGGFVQPNTWYWRGEKGPELVKSGPMGDSVMSNGDSRAFMQTGNVYMTVNARDVESFNSRRTQTQIKRAMEKMQKAA